MTYARPDPSAVDFDYPAPYTPPAGDGLEFDFEGVYEPSPDFVVGEDPYTPSPDFVIEGYSPPPGDELEFDFVVEDAYVRPPHDAVDFDWGEATDVVVEVEISGSFAPLTISAIVIPGIDVEVSGSFAPLTITCQVDYHSNTERPLVSQVTSYHQGMEGVQSGLEHYHQQGARLPVGVESPYQSGEGLSAGIQVIVKKTYQKMYLERVGDHQQGSALQAGLMSRHQDGQFMTHGRISWAQEGTKVQAGMVMWHQDGTKVHRGQFHSHTEATPLLIGIATNAQFGTPLFHGIESWHQEGRVPPPGISPFPTKPVDPPPWTCYTPDPAILFFRSWVESPAILFRCDSDIDEPPIVPVGRKVYFIVNSVSLKRLDDDTNIALDSVSVGIDRSSWCWSFSASVPFTERDKVELTSGLVEVELTINGLVWRFQVEDYAEGAEFGARTSINIRGRSLTAALGDTMAPVRSFVQDSFWTARALAEDALTYSGVPLGYDIDWNMGGTLGWDLPDGSVSYANLTPIQVVQLIANGGGGYVNSHPNLKRLLVRPDYPIPFWGWDAATVDKVIPKSLIFGRNIQWLEKPAYNGVYISGQNTGVNDLVRRSGTAGDYRATMVVDQMIGDSVASALRGTSVLSAGGKQASISLALPLHPDLGLITPGMLIEVVNAGFGTDPAWRGLIRGTAISATLGNSLKVVQSIDIERHFGDIA